MKLYCKKKMTAARETSSSDRQALLLLSVGSPSLSTTPTNNSSSSASCSPIPVSLLQKPPCTPSCDTAAGGEDDEHEVGRYYEINRTHLPPKSPSQLNFVRVVMVKAKTKLDLTVSFPSMQSLKKCFKVESIDELTTGNSTDPMQVGRKKRKLSNVTLHPELDEQFLMSTDDGLRILSRPVPTAELNSSQGYERFWVCNTKTCGLENNEAVLKSDQKEVDKDIKTVDALRWGVKRRASYCGRQKGNAEKNCSTLSSLVTMIDEDEGKAMEKIEMGVVENNKRGRKCKMNKNIIEYRKKLKREKKKKEISKFGMALAPNTKLSTAIVYNKNSKDRWSIERYETAEMKLLSIMKQKNAVIGNRILRQELREEARKHIGDTGLLDHLLKHMSGKVVSDGKERFRRRHNSDGAMEYWIEDVELEEMRKSAGVADSGWVPPPGWKIGDGVCTCEGSFSMGCAVELVKLKEEINCLRRELEEVHCLKQMEQEKKTRDCQSDANAVGSEDLQKNMESLLKWKTKVEDEIISMVSSLHRVKEDVRLMREEMKQMTEMRESKEREDCQPKSDKKEDDNKVEKCGFRIWKKPQGTLKWLNMSANPSTNSSNISGTITTTKTANVGHNGCGGSSNKSNIYMASSKSLVVPFDDIFGVPTPPSAASPPVLPLQLQVNNNGRRHHHCYPAGNISADSTSHAVFSPKTSMMMKGVEEWNTISTDLALASLSYNH